MLHRACQTPGGFGRVLDTAYQPKAAALTSALEIYRAPFLFAVLLRKSGVAPGLLPLLAEPARAAVHGLAITARRRRPTHIAAFLAALKEIVSGAKLEAGESKHPGSSLCMAACFLISC